MGLSGARLILSDEKIGHGTPTLQFGQDPLEGEGTWPVKRDLSCSESVRAPSSFPGCPVNRWCLVIAPGGPVAFICQQKSFLYCVLSCQVGS